ncbi:TetR family transcriptional regulator [Rhodococcus sp. T2V]|uniref:TetR family transcriptional regulator n=1 Tax=Rhodococcus sp. T2V TaxID=3034164 RepID=UPI0023E2F0D4|nr:TetR family transcriptional regulator [Rhodococcus sp. T2V]MDF3309679.1 TetR family transcriptional regulator [Rhodococcus sp. T2V]
MDFQRARSEEQREHRRQAILATAAAMLTEMPVAQVSLNELSRRVGLAKSNVLRYFESREAVLLEVLDTEVREWVTDLQRQATQPTPETLTERIEHLTTAIATSLASRPVLCDLLHAESGVLEHNVSVDIVLRHKHATQHAAAAIADTITTALPEVTPHDAEEVIVTLLLVGAAAWPYAQPSEALTTAYQQDPTVAAMHRNFTTIVQRTLSLTTRGLLAHNDAMRSAGLRPPTKPETAREAPDRGDNPPDTVQLGAPKPKGRPDSMKAEHFASVERGVELVCEPGPAPLTDQLQHNSETR